MDACKRYRGLIVTDYLDGELAGKRKDEVESHMRSCAGCRELYRQMKDGLEPIFGQAKGRPVPDHIWPQLKKKIQDRTTRFPRVTFKDIMERYLAPLRIPVLVPAAATAIMVFAIGALIIFNFQMRQTRETEQAEYLEYILGPVNGVTGTETNSLGTSIEEYFL